MSVVVIAKIYPKAAHRDEVISAFQEILPLVHAEEGCELYALHSAEDRLVMVEKWSTQAALDAHTAGDVIGALLPKLEGKMDDVTQVTVLVPLLTDAGALGAV